MKQQNHSKMVNLHYNSLNIQSYFTSEELKTEEKRTIFKYRVRMANFGENYRGGAYSTTCPLCNLHLDNQEMSFQCPIIRNMIKVEGNISDIYKEDIEKQTIQTILKITNYRNNNLEKQ